MSGIHFDDGELQRICAEESVWGCKEKENETESLAVEKVFIEKNIVCDIDFEKRGLDNKEINHFEDKRSRYDMFIVSCALQIGVDVEERKESGTTKCYKVSNSRHRSREPSRIGQKYKQGVQKSLKMRRLFKKYVVLLYRSLLSFLSLVGEEFFARNIFVLSIILLVIKEGKKFLKGIIVT